MIARPDALLCTLFVLAIATDVSTAQDPAETVHAKESAVEQNRITETLLEELSQIGTGRHDHDHEIDLIAAAAERPNLDVDDILKTIVKDAEPSLVTFHALYALRLRGEGDEYYWNIIKAGEAHEYTIGFAVHILALDWEDLDAEERAFIRKQHPDNYFANRAIASVEGIEHIERLFAEDRISRDKLMRMLLSRLISSYSDFSLDDPRSSLSVKTLWAQSKLRQLSEESPQYMAERVLDVVAPRHLVGYKPMTWNQYVADCLSQETNELIEEMRAERATDNKEEHGNGHVDTQPLSK